MKVKFGENYLKGWGICCFTLQSEYREKISVEVNVSEGENRITEGREDAKMELQKQKIIIIKGIVLCKISGDPRKKNKWIEF